MAAIHKITEDFYEDSFALIALHSSLEDFAIVYSINQCLKSNLCRSRTDLDISQNISFPIFEWKDLKNDRYWTLITNSSVQEENIVQSGLFQNEPSYTTYQLLPEHKEVDYFLKIEMDEGNGEDEIVKLILTIPGVITAYTLETNKLKSKNNLIF